MKNNLPSIYDGRFIYKIRKWITSIFYKKEEVEEVITVEENKCRKNDAFEQMKEKSKKERLKNDKIDIIENNPELLYSLSISQLEEVDKMYEQLVEEHKRKIRILKRKIAEA